MDSGIGTPVETAAKHVLRKGARGAFALSTDVNMELFARRHLQDPFGIAAMAACTDHGRG